MEKNNAENANYKLCICLISISDKSSKVLYSKVNLYVYFEEIKDYGKAQLGSTNVFFFFYSEIVYIA